MDAWAHEMDNNVLADALSALCAQSPLAERQMAAWCVSRDEWIASTGWNMAAHLAMSDEGLPDEKFLALIETIEHEIHNVPNHVRHTMNGSLIAIGLRNAKLEKAAIDAAKRIGRVEVDHGDTACKTPDAIEYIQKAVARRKDKSTPIEAKRAPRRSANGKSPKAAKASQSTSPSSKKATTTKAPSQKTAKSAKSAKKAKKSPPKPKPAAKRKIQRAATGSSKGTKKTARNAKTTAKRS
jgi:hypothetical protein